MRDDPDFNKAICQSKALTTKMLIERREHAQKMRIDPDFSRAVNRLRESNQKIVDDREKRRIIFLENAPKIQSEGQGAKCKARTMDNKPCPFRATCGEFCKRHKV
jgi:hypothetical protein